MPSLASLHPHIVHFAIAPLAVGVALRWLSLTGKAPFAAVRDHEEWGHRSRTIFLAIAALEVLGLVRAKRPGLHPWAYRASAVVGLLGGYALLEVGGKGGALVYSFAGGPGLRTGDTADIGRLFTAGLYEQAMVDRARHQSAGAAALIDELARRSPGVTTVELLRIESLLLDRHDPTGTLAALAALRLPADNPRLRVRAGSLAADAYVAAGRPDSARAVLRRLVAEFPAFRRLKDRLVQLGG